MEILHFNAIHHVAVDILKPIGWFLTLMISLEYNLHVFHLFLYGFLSEGISVLLFDGNHLCDHLRQLDPKFMGPLRYQAMHHFTMEIILSLFFKTQ